MATSKLFTAIVGNPPYQEEVTGVRRNPLPLYYSFYNLAESLSSYYCIISPARFLTNSGYTPESWNQYMINNPHIRIVEYIENSCGLFPEVNISGGVVACFYNVNKIFDHTAREIRGTLDNQIKQKIITKDFISIQSKMSIHSKLNLKAIYQDFPEIKQSRSIGVVNNVRTPTNAFTVFSTIFTKNKDENHSIGIFGKGEQNTNKIMYLSKKYMIQGTTSTPFNQYKVVIPKAYGVGPLNSPLAMATVLNKGIGHTASFRTLGSCKTKQEALNLKKYSETKFFTFLMNIVKSTQDMPPKVFRYVPVQDFSNQSDIDWSKPVDEIDKQLYNKYGLTSEEIEYIENNIQPME